MNEQYNVPLRKLAVVQSIVPTPKKTPRKRAREKAPKCENLRLDFIHRHYAYCMLEFMCVMNMCTARDWFGSSIFTLAARVSLSPDSPTQMFRHNLRICKSRITFLAGSFLIFLAESA